MLEDVPQDIVINTLKVWCVCVSVLLFFRVCVCVCVPSIIVREKLYLHFLNFVCVRACNREGTSHKSSRVDGRLECVKSNYRPCSEAAWMPATRSTNRPRYIK